MLSNALRRSNLLTQRTALFSSCNSKKDSGLNPKGDNSKKSFYFAQDYNPEFLKQIQRQNQIRSNKEFRFAIVGTGPAGFYLAKNLLKNVENCRIDLFDRNPHPFGLIRTGVSPDHQAMKRIEKDFTTVLHDEKVEFFGNVWLGDQAEAQQRDCRSVSLAELKENYSAVCLAYGATSDRELGLEGEKTLKGVLPSRRVVDWYNGSLDCDLKSDEFDIRAIEEMAIIGNGNIACDITRMLTRKVEDFADCDAPLSVLDALRQSNLHTVQMVGRRGITQSAFTTKEIKELCNLEHIKLYMVGDEFDDSMTDASKVEKLLRGVGRRTDYLEKKATFIEGEEHYLDVLSRKDEKKLILRYLRSPVELIEDSERPGHIGSVKLQRMKLEGEAEKQRAVAYDDYEDSEAFSNLRCQALVKSIGYKSMQIPGVPFDPKRNVIPHSFGCVKDLETDQLQVGLYCAGWIKRGPVGIIDATLRDAMETFKIMKHHLEHDMLPGKTTTVDEVKSMLTHSDDKASSAIIEKSGWAKIETEEIKRGAQHQKKKEKILDKTEMINIAVN